jgi:replicative DNA helicase
LKRIEHEQAIIGTLLNAPEYIQFIEGLLRPHHFFLMENQKVYEAILALSSKGKVPSYLNVSDMVGSDLELFVKESKGIYSFEELKDAVESVINQWMLREVKTMGMDIAKVKDTTNPWQVVDELSAKLYTISQNKVGTFKPLSQGTEKILKRAEDYRAGIRPSIKTMYGLPEFETQMEGINDDEGELIVVSGRPGHGKSSLFNNHLVATARREEPIAMWSGEMSETGTLLRYFAASTGIPSARIKDGSFLDSPDLNAEFQKARKRLTEKVLYNFGPMTWEQLKPLMIHYHVTMGCRDFIIDRLELLFTDAKMTEEERIKRICGELRLVTTKYQMRIELAIQMRKSSEDNRGGRPVLADVLGGTASTNDATKAILLYRPEARNCVVFPDGDSCIGKGELIVAKNTFGPTHEGYRLDYLKQMQVWKESSMLPGEEAPF